MDVWRFRTPLAWNVAPAPRCWFLSRGAERRRDSVAAGRSGKGQHALRRRRPCKPPTPKRCRPGTMHTRPNRPTGDRLWSSVDDRPLGEVHVDAATRFGLQLSVDGGEVEVADITVHEPEGEPIFNGQDLTGWWSPRRIEIVARHGWSDRMPAQRWELSTHRKNLRQLHAVVRIPGLARTAIRASASAPSEMAGPRATGSNCNSIDAPGLNKDSTMAIYRQSRAACPCRSP